ncbi:hypothetical protein VDGL01_04507 [Verticillium dahliae]
MFAQHCFGCRPSTPCWLRANEWNWISSARIHYTLHHLDDGSWGFAQPFRHATPAVAGIPEPGAPAWPGPPDGLVRISRVSGAYRDEPDAHLVHAALAEMERRFGVARPDLEHLVVQNTATPWRALQSSSPPSPPPPSHHPPVEAFGEDGDVS